MASKIVPFYHSALCFQNRCLLAFQNFRDEQQMHLEGCSAGLMTSGLKTCTLMLINDNLARESHDH